MKGSNWGICKIGLEFFTSVQGDEGSLVLEVYPKLCLAAGDEMMEAGPFFMRDLFVEICQVVLPELRTWEVVG